MESLFSETRHLTLFELNGLIKATLQSGLPDLYWLTAEIADCKINQKGHCYMDLVEKEEDKTIAQMKATIWSYDFRKIGVKFETVTGEALKPGMKVLLLAGVTFHEVYGLGLNVKDIDPNYTLGEMARKKKEVIERLRKEGLINLNKEILLPLVPQRIAVISSPTAAGYGDFVNQIEHNPYGYRLSHQLFPALMQGVQAEQSVMAALEEVRSRKGLFDVLVIIRGGGSVTDLNCFDTYGLAADVAKFPLPVITGIGHEKDDTVVDIVAHTRMKTPTAVAEFLISGLRSFEENIEDIWRRVVAFTEGFLKEQRYALDTLTRSLGFAPLRLTSLHQNRTIMLKKDLANGVRRIAEREDNRLRAMEQAVKHLDPENILRRGYSITRHKGHILKDPSTLKKWAVIETRLMHGIVTSIVQDKKEAKTSEQGQAADLLPGFERA